MIDMMLWLFYVIITVIFLLALAYIHHRSQRRSWPPGHKSYPLVGCLPMMIAKKTSIIEMVKDDRKQFGDISSFPLINMNFGKSIMTNYHYMVTFEI